MSAHDWIHKLGIVQEHLHCDYLWVWIRGCFSQNWLCKRGFIVSPGWLNTNGQCVVLVSFHLAMLWFCTHVTRHKTLNGKQKCIWLVSSSFPCHMFSKITHFDGHYAMWCSTVWRLGDFNTWASNLGAQDPPIFWMGPILVFWALGSKINQKMLCDTQKNRSL